MNLLVFMCLLLRGTRSARRQTMDRTVRVLTHGKFSEHFFDAAWPHYELKPLRSLISKDRQR